MSRRPRPPRDATVPVGELTELLTTAADHARRARGVLDELESTLSQARAAAELVDVDPDTAAKSQLVDQLRLLLGAT